MSKVSKEYQREIVYESHNGQKAEKSNSLILRISFIVIGILFILICILLWLLFAKSYQETNIDFSLGPTSGSTSQINDTEKLSTMDEPLSFGETITIHTSCPVNLFNEGTIDMYTLEITPLDYAIVGTDTIIEFEIKLVSFDNDNEQSMGTDDIINGCVNLIGKNGASNNWACDVYAEFEEAYQGALKGKSGNIFSIRAGGTDTYYVRFHDMSEPAFLEITAKTYISWQNYDYVRNYYSMS